MYRTVPAPMLRSVFFLHLWSIMVKIPCSHFREGVAAIWKGIFQAVNNQHSDNGIGKDFAKVGNTGRGSFAFREEDERQKSCKHGSCCYGCNRQDALYRCHNYCSPASLSFVFLLAKRQRIMHAMDGSMKFPLPNTARQAAEHPSPVRPACGSLFFPTDR